MTWEQNGDVRIVHWGQTDFRLSQDLVDDILSQYFNDTDRWHPLGASMDLPMPGGLGEYLRANSTLTPRHASAVAAILVSEGELECRGQRPIELRKRVGRRGE
jgi:hypothetical protein